MVVFRELKNPIRDFTASASHRNNGAAAAVQPRGFTRRARARRSPMLAFDRVRYGQIRVSPTRCGGLAVTPIVMLKDGDPFAG
jgi:hypothetical protein